MVIAPILLLLMKLPLPLNAENSKDRRRARGRRRRIDHDGGRAIETADGVPGDGADIKHTGGRSAGAWCSLNTGEGRQTVVVVERGRGLVDAGDDVALTSSRFRCWSLADRCP